MVLSFLLISTLAFAQDAEDRPTPPRIEAKKPNRGLRGGAPRDGGDSELDELEKAQRGRSNEDRLNTTLSPLMVGQHPLNDC